MGFWLLLFLLTPIVEMYLLIEVGGHIGALPTIALVMFTAVVGLGLLRHQGLATLTRGMGRMQRGEVPAREVAEGILLAVAGALLITPGFVTDLVGFVLLVPTLRGRIAAPLAGRFSAAEEAPATGPGQIIEGEYEIRSADGPAGGSADGPAGGSVEGPAGGSADGPADGSADGSADSHAHHSADRPTDGSATNRDSKTPSSGLPNPDWSRNENDSAPRG